MIPYGSIKVNKNVHDCCLADIKKQNYVVKLPKLSNVDIELWHYPDESWKQIDPYSDLEDIGETKTEQNIDNIRDANT